MYVFLSLSCEFWQNRVLSWLLLEVTLYFINLIAL